MRAILIPATLIAALATGTAIEPVQAKGCIKGAIVGGIAGHAVHHGVLGAAGGCAAGRHLANVHARRQQQMQQDQGTSYNNGAAPQNQAPVDNNGPAMQNQ